MDGEPKRLAALADPVRCASYAVDVAGDHTIEGPLLLQAAQRSLITLLERRLYGDQLMGQPEGRRLTAHQRQGVSEKAGRRGSKGGQCHHLMTRIAGITERQHGIFATAPEQDDARHG
ncbi:hypothetical protein D3C86_1695780 [compost metagenome]